MLNISKELLYYCEGSLSCIIALAIILHYRNRRLNNNTERLVSSIIAYSAIIYIVGDIGIAITDSTNVELLNSAIYFFASFAFIAGTAAAYTWVVYSEFLLTRKLELTGIKALVAGIPLFIDVVLTLLSPFFGFYYRIENGSAAKGPLFNVHMLIIIAYILFVMIRNTVILVFDENSSKKADIYGHNIIFSMPLIITAVLQLFFFGHPIYSSGLTLFILATQLSSTTHMVTADELTGINNRNQLIKFLETKMHSYALSNDKLNHLFLFIMDVDNFKKINDTYGHVEGDEALMIVAKTLKQMSGRYNCFCSRYGGDEFVMVGELYDSTSARAFSHELNTLLAEHNKKAGNSYELQLSIGFAQYDESITTIPEFIDKADRMLYNIKKARKAGNFY